MLSGGRFSSASRTFGEAAAGSTGSMRAMADEFDGLARSIGANTSNEEEAMGKVVVSQFVTLDGVVEDPGGSEKLDRGGWAFEFNRGEDGDKFKFDELMGADALLLGRKTYEGFASAWPGREDEAGFADKFNNMRKYVASTTLSDPDWNNSQVLGSDLSAEVARIKGKNAYDLL